MDLKMSLTITEALRLQREVQERLHEQLETQEKVRLQIEEQHRLKMLMLENQKKAETDLAQSVLSAEDGISTPKNDDSASSAKEAGGSRSPASELSGIYDSVH